MKNSDFTARDKIVMRRSSPLFAPALVIAATFLIGNQSFADGPYFRVVYADVPGVEELEAGNTQVGIKILKNQLNQEEQGNSGDIWATLCAAYIVIVSLDQAEHACSNAVEIAPTYPALNNRGVFRAFKGDLSGAREDFDRARPLQLEAYLKQLTRKDVRVVAANNFRLVDEELARRSLENTDATIARSGAEIEDPSH
ncbi:MAG: hypothetical protein KAJ57_12035 [Woeseiaceae bacterium]|nr:hypothetical protein [Woeseiaceae bacterium]